jgi:hypothetical protein
VIRIDQLWLRIAPMDMRAGAERLMNCVVQTTGAAARIPATSLRMRGPRA